MDFDRINLLLSVVHKSLNVPNTARIRDNALAELEQHNMNIPTPVDEPEETEDFVESEEPDDPELSLGDRRL